MTSDEILVLIRKKLEINKLEKEVNDLKNKYEELNNTKQTKIIVYDYIDANFYKLEICF